MSDSPRDRRTSLPVLGLVVASSLASVVCSVNSAAISPTRISVEPGVICPDEVVQVTWGCAGGATPLCDSAEVSSVAGAAFGPFTEKSGSRSAPFGEDTTLQIVARRDSESESATALVQVIDEGSIRPLDRTFEGRCVGAMPSWSRIDAKTELSRCVEIVEIVNASSYLVRITTEDGRSAELNPGGGDAGALGGQGQIMTVEVLGLPPDPSRCGSTATSSPPPDIAIRVHTRCDRTLPGCESP